LNNQNQRANIHDDTAFVISSPATRHGLASGMDLPIRAGSGRLFDHSSRRFKFFVGEILGLFFIIATAAYIFAVPTALTRPGVIKGLMNRLMKRTIDIAGSLAGLVLTLPLWLVLPIIIKLDSPGPVFYRQVRVGVNRRRRSRRYHQREGSSERRGRERRREDLLGKPFRMIKFRTMVNDAERKSGPVWASRNDSRVTTIGKIMRKTRMDEIPQFINILKGDMSLVGPRPERPKFVRELSEQVEDYTSRLQVKPGLTGLAQVENGYDSSVSTVVAKVRFDLQYIRSWSIFSDIRIILKTFVVVFTGRGAC
jgi:lipopolysaccharide/colanic/teichoic acid biosynthesis glycosyltransferase